MKEANGTSVKGMPDGKEHTVSFYAPTGEEWVAHFKDGLARLASDYNQHKVANNLASGLKSAFKTVLGIDRKETPSDKTMAKAKELVRRVEAGEVFDLREFVPSEPRISDKGASDSDVIELLEAKWAESDKKAEFLTTFGSSQTLDAATTAEVIEAFKNRKKAKKLNELL